MSTAKLISKEVGRWEGWDGLFFGFGFVGLVISGRYGRVNPALSTVHLRSFGTSGKGLLFPLHMQNPWSLSVHFLLIFDLIGMSFLPSGSPQNTFYHNFRIKKAGPYDPASFFHKGNYFFSISLPQHCNGTLHAPSSPVLQEHVLVTWSSRPQDSHTKTSPCFMSAQSAIFCPSFC